MFCELQTNDHNHRFSVLVSFVLHAAIIALVLHRPGPVFVTPSSPAHGNSDKSYHVTYFAFAGIETLPSERRLLSQAKPQVHAPRLKHTTKTADLRQQGNPSEIDATAGSPYGSLYEGPTEGHDVRPAYPVVFPDPPIDQAVLPDGFEGEVVVEVTIDVHGNVIETRLLQGVGHGIDEKIVATLKNWRYNPATMDGSPIAEKHDVHFHLPS